MTNIDEAILDIDKIISSNISRFDDSERGLLSQNILAQIRNLVEYISLKIISNDVDIDINYDNITRANNFVSSRGELKFLNKFHNLLQKSTSHYSLDEENSERLMLKYYEYFLKIKDFLKKKFNLEVLTNIDEFPIKIDSALREYYEKIAEKINLHESSRTKNTYTDRYYIHKVKPFFVGHNVYYEVTITTATDRLSKFDRIIAFTKLDITHNYAVKFVLSNDNIEVFGKRMPIQIIENWEVSIRPCEVNNFGKILGRDSKIKVDHIEYLEIMDFLKRTGLNLSEIINLPLNYYDKFKSLITAKAKTTHFLGMLDKSRVILMAKAPGQNVLKYLLYRMHNTTIKKQYTNTECSLLSNLHLEFGCKPFDEMPFTTSLLDHNPKLFDLFDCIDSAYREHELFARYIKNNTEMKAQLYTSRDEIKNFANIDTLMLAYNERLYWKHFGRKLDDYKSHIYINEYDDHTYRIMETLKKSSKSGIKNYSRSFDSWLGTTSHQIDCDEKRENLRLMFENSEVALIYGSAGTGKSTLINHISNFFNDKSKLYLANTNPAVDNLKRRVKASDCTFMTIAKYLSSRKINNEYDILFIDECSTLSNADMLNVLNKVSFKLLVLVGDIFQIESIRFGNWFSMVRSFVPSTSVCELTKPYRSDNEKLLELWKRVRNIDPDILEHITKNNYSARLDDTIFDYAEPDEIILCLNYDGLYGINNINTFLQGNNTNPPIQWGVQTYKVGDPILFNDSKRFTPVIYNNLKGKIVSIELLEDSIQFEIEVDKVLNELDAEGYTFELLDDSENGNSIIKFSVSKLLSTDEDDDDSSEAVVPFQVSYAVSIHKAQGLEYDSVKIVITDEIDERVTHNIFYTAITRARKKLKIFWTPESEHKILSSLEKRNSKKDEALLASKHNL